MPSEEQCKQTCTNINIVVKIGLPVERWKDCCHYSKSLIPLMMVLDVTINDLGKEMEAADYETLAIFVDPPVGGFIFFN